MRIVDHYKGKSESEAMREFDALLEEAEQEATRASEIGFVSDMKSRFDRYGAKTLVSVKQFNWLQGIAGSRDEPYDESNPDRNHRHGD